jgi:hypothetical protein
VQKWKGILIILILLLNLYEQVTTTAHENWNGRSERQIGSPTGMTNGSPAGTKMGEEGQCMHMLFLMRFDWQPLIWIGGSLLKSLYHTPLIWYTTTHTY